MKATARLVMAAAAVLFLAGVSAAADKNQDLIVGKWSPADEKGKGVTLEFTKGGDLKIGVKNEMVNLDLSGKYKFSDDKTIEITVEAPGGKGEKKTEKIKVVSISADELVVENPQGKKETFKKVK